MSRKINSVTLTPEEIDAKLDEATILQLTFKPDKSCAVAVAIVRHMLAQAPAPTWADTVPLPDLGAEDKNAIGLAWRRLKNVGIVAQTGDHRRSTRKERRGGVVWKYSLVSLKLATTFMHRNGHKAASKQAELFA